MHAIIHISDRFVCATAADNTTFPVVIRTYDVYANATFDCTVWQACCATAALPPLFYPIYAGQQHLEEQLIAGDVKISNPTMKAIEEAKSIWGSRKVACLVNIGTGRTDVIKFSLLSSTSSQKGDILLQLLKEIGSNSEAVARECERRFPGLDSIYTRLNVDRGMEEVGMVEWNKHSEMVTHAKQYLLQPTVTQQVDLVVERLCSAEGLVTIDQMSMRLFSFQSLRL